MLLSRRTALFFVLLVASSISLASAAWAQSTAEVFLEPTVDGSAISASGIAALWDGGETEFFRVRANADLPDGSVLVVSIWDGADTWDVGSISLDLGSGILRLNSNAHPRSPAFPVQNVLQIRVRLLADDVMVGSVDDEFRFGE